MNKKIFEYLGLGVFVLAGVVLSLTINASSKNQSSKPIYTKSVLSDTTTDTSTSGTGEYSEDGLKRMCEEDGCKWSSNTCDCSELQLHNNESTSTGTATETFEPEPTQEPTSTQDPEPTSTTESDDDKALRCEEYGCSWDSAANTCYCDETTSSSSSSPEPTFESFSSPTSTSSSNSESEDHGSTTEEVDRLSSVDEGTLSCIKGRLTSNEIDLIRFLVPTTSAEDEILRSLHDKARICFEDYSETKNIELASSEVVKMDASLEVCLVSKVGRTAFEEINSGLREPTAIERIRGQECFEGEHESVISYKAEEEIEEDVETCLALARSDESLTELQLRERVQRCFGDDPHPLSGPPKHEISVELRLCLQSSVGEERFGLISTGQAEPTIEEREIGESCFESINEVQKELLPPPPEQVPFLSESKEVSVTTVDQLVNRSDKGVVDQTIVLKGFGPPNSIVDITIFSDPIVVTTSTDDNGEWIYELKDPVEGTSHVAYAVISDNLGNKVRSSVLSFEVVAASELEASAPLLDESETATSAQNFVRNAAIIILIVVAIVSILISVVNVKKLFSTEGNSNSKDTPSSIN